MNSIFVVTLNAVRSDGESVKNKVTMKTGRQYQVLNHIVSQIELIINELENAKNESDLNSLENQTYEG